MRKEAEQFLLQARRDLENAAKNIDFGAFEVAAFLCHQSLEKYLKAAYITKKQKRGPKTHSLHELGQMLDAPTKIATMLRALNPDYTVSRYPDAANGVPYEVYDEEIARAKLQTAREVARWIESLIQS